jgi:hypothetical protein
MYLIFFLTAVIVVLIVLNIREVIYIRRLWIASGDEDGTRSFVLRAMYQSNLTTTIVCGWFLIAIYLRLAFGDQFWLGIISGLAIVLVLMIPYLRGRELRK